LADSWLLPYNSGIQSLDGAVGTARDVSIRDAELFSQCHHLMNADE